MSRLSQMDLDELRAFVAVVDRGSIAAASKSLRFPVATLRRRLDELEARLGVKLLDRARDGAVPTSAGSAVVDKARALLQDAAQLWESARGSSDEARQEMMVGVPPSLAPELASPFISLMFQVAPNVAWTFRIVEDLRSSSLTDLAAVLHLGDELPDASWNAREIRRVDARLLASRDYLARHGTPSKLEDLARHPLILWQSPTTRGDVLPLLDGGQLPVRPAVRSSEVWLLRQCAARGNGVAFLPAPRPPRDSFSAPEDLVPVLDDLVGSSTKFSLLVRSSMVQSPLAALALEHVHRLAALLV
jgi:DNA-binding transcriptional LysR family regulator